MNQRLKAYRFLPLPIVFALLLTVFVAGSAEARKSKDGMLRAFHNSPDTPAVDVWVNGQKTLERVSYGDLSPYLEVPQGKYDIQIKVFPSIDSDPAALAATVKVGRNPLTVAAIGSLSGAGEGLRAQVYQDADGPRWSFLSRLRVAHTSPDAPPVDIQVALFDRWITVIPGLAFGESSKYLTLPALAFDFRVVIAGTETVALDLPDTQLPRGTAVTVWAVNPVSSIAAFVSVDGR